MKHKKQGHSKTQKDSRAPDARGRRADDERRAGGGDRRRSGSPSGTGSGGTPGTGNGPRHGDGGRGRGNDRPQFAANYDAVVAGRLPPEKLAMLVARSQHKLAALIGGQEMPESASYSEPSPNRGLRPGTPATSPRSPVSGATVPFVPSRSYLRDTKKAEVAEPNQATGHGQVPAQPSAQSSVPGHSASARGGPAPVPTPQASGPDRGFDRARARKQEQLVGAPGPQPVTQQGNQQGNRAGQAQRKPAHQTAAAHALPTTPAKLSDLISPPLAKTAGGLTLDPWQSEAFQALLAGDNVVIDAPTSAGKTRVIEALLEHRMKEGIKLVYTSPVKSLSNDKYREFTDKYGKDKVGINTGDFKENLGAPIILATLETYRNSLLGVEPNMNRRVVVYDEYHYLQDESRGSAWEESLILTPKESQLVLLSASVPNAEDFADWLKTLSNRDCKVIRVLKRPVPLVDMVHTQAGWIVADDLGVTPEETANLKHLLKRAKAAQRGRYQHKGKFDDLIVPVSRALDLNMGPLVIYAGRRADVEGIAQALARGLRSAFPQDDYERLIKRIETLQGWDYVPVELQRLVRKYGIAYHHSGMIPPGRVAIETLLKEGCLRICTGTMGISLGVNFAVRSAMVADESRPSEGGETHYTNTEVMQMLGRAGRRGHDLQGFSLWLNLGRYAEQKPRGREPCRSSLKFDPTTVLGILGQHENFAYLSEFYRKSFFMRGRAGDTVLLEDHDLIHSLLYREHGFETVPCDDIPTTYRLFQEGKKRSTVPCAACPARPSCHPLVAQARSSVLQTIVSHLQKVGALEHDVPTRLGQLARHFPQAGGLIVARWIATGEMTGENFKQYIQAMAMFCSAHFKDISDMYADVEFLQGLRVPKLIDTFYPEKLFPELYDEVGSRGGGNFERETKRVFREFNPAAASIVSAWLDQRTSWEDLVNDHTSKYFSAGDCMMVLFRFSTFLQSCSRIQEFNPSIASQAKDALKLLLREPLDARNRMLLEETEAEEAAAKPPPDDESDDESDDIVGNAALEDPTDQE